jgi:hypothetical protein
MTDVKQLPCAKTEPLLQPVKQMSDEEFIERLISLNATLAAQQERIEALEAAHLAITNIGVAVSVRPEVQIAEARTISRAALKGGQ